MVKATDSWKDFYIFIFIFCFFDLSVQFVIQFCYMIYSFARLRSSIAIMVMEAPCRFDARKVGQTYEEGTV